MRPAFAKASADRGCDVTGEERRPPSLYHIYYTGMYGITATGNSVLYRGTDTYNAVADTYVIYLWDKRPPQRYRTYTVTRSLFASFEKVLRETMGR